MSLNTLRLYFFGLRAGHFAADIGAGMGVRLVGSLFLSPLACMRARPPLTRDRAVFALPECVRVLHMFMAPAPMLSGFVADAAQRPPYPGRGR